MPLPNLQIVLRPGILDLGWGHPDPNLLPVDALRRAADAALDRLGAEALQYGHPAGPGALREWLLAYIARTEGRAPTPDEILITGGISSGLDLLLTLGFQPGDTVLVESPTYHLAVRILRDHGLHLVPVPSDEEGLNVDALASAVAALKQAGRRPHALYLVPTFNNPTGVSLSEARRAALIALAEAEGVLIIEDDVYRELAYDAPAPPSLWSLAPAGVVARLGTFAKSLAPGLRVGWLTAGASTIARLAESGLLDSGGGLNHFTALVVAALCASGDFEAHTASLRAAYRTRRDALQAALAQHLPPGCRAHPAPGGFFTWVSLPAGLDAGALLPRAEAAGVSYLPGSLFYLEGGAANALRLAFSLYPPETLAEAARRLGQVLAEAA